MTPTEQAVAEWRGRNAVDSDGDKIGSIDEIYKEQIEAEGAGTEDSGKRGRK